MKQSDLEKSLDPKELSKPLYCQQHNQIYRVAKVVCSVQYTMDYIMVLYLRTTTVSHLITFRLHIKIDMRFKNVYVLCLHLVPMCTQ
jgi:hypothetical protein